MMLKIIKKISLKWLLSFSPQCACFIMFATLLLVESFTFEGDVFVSSSRKNGFRMILTRMDDLIENKTSRDAIASNVTRITGKLSMTGSFDWNERHSIFAKLRSVDSLELFNVYGLDNDILSSLLYIKGNLTITNSDVLSSRFDVLPNLRIIRGSFKCIDTQKSTSSSIRNFATTLEKIGQNFEVHVSESHRNIASTVFPSLESVGGSFLINATKSLKVLEIGCFRNLYQVGDFMISGESIRSLSNFMSLQVIKGRLDLKATPKLRSLDGLQNLRRVESGDINFGSALTRGGALFGRCGRITLNNEKMKESNKTAYVIQHSCFYDNYRWCQSMLLPNAYRCVDSIATKIIRNRNLRKFSNVLDSSAEILRLQALQKPMTVFAPIDAAFLFLRSTLSEKNGRKNSEYDEPSFSTDQATLRNVVRAHVFSSSIDLSTIVNDEKLISNLGEMEALEILLSHDGVINTQPRSVAHALAVQRQALSLPLRSISPRDASVCTSFTFRHKVEGKNALLSKYCEDTTLSARIMLRPIDIMPFDEENEAASANASSSSALNLDVTSSTCLNRCGTCDNIELNTCCCDEACVQNGDCCGDFSYFCSLQYFLSREESPKDNVVRNAFTPSRNFASGETESAALIIKSNIAQAHNGAKLILVDRVLHPIGRYHSSKLLLYKQRNETNYFVAKPESLPPPPPPPPRPPPAPRRVTELSWLYQTRPPPPTTSVDLQSPQPPVSPPSPAPTVQIPPQALSPPPTSADAGSCRVQLPSICGLCDYTHESNVCCCDSLCESTGDCCEDYIETCV